MAARAFALSFVQLLLIVNLTALLEYCVSTMPLTLRDAWQKRGIRIDFPSMWPLRVELEYIDADGSDGETGSKSAHEGGDGEKSGGSSNNAPDLRGSNATGDDDSAHTLAPTADAELLAQRKLRLHVLLWTPLVAITQDIWLQYYIT